MCFKMAAGKGELLFLFTFYLVLARILDDRTYKEDFNEQLYKLDVSIFLIRGSDRALAFFDVVELWSTSPFDSPQNVSNLGFVNITCLGTRHTSVRLDDNLFFSHYDEVVMCISSRSQL